jgi:hypothetical protein
LVSDRYAASFGKADFSLWLAFPVLTAAPIGLEGGEELTF